MSGYSVFLADDERMIRDGIGTLIPWEQLGLRFIGAAPNGLIAHQHILDARPDIVITDIKMPVMNGLELIKLTLEHDPDMQFIVLSGYNEFEFATQAMQYGVKHYLLKPCNEVEITQVLLKVVEELDRTSSRKNYVKDIEGQLAEALPIKKEKLILDCLLNLISSREKIDLYKRALQMDNGFIHMVLIQMTKSSEENQAEALRHMTDNWVGNCRILFNTAIEDKFVVLVEDEPWMNSEWLSSTIKNHYSIGAPDAELNLVISEACRLEDLGETYQDALKKLKYRDYFGQSSVIMSEVSASLPSGEAEQLNLLVDQVVQSIKLGNIDELKEGLALFFDKLREIRGEIHLTIGYCMELLSTISRQTDPDQSNMRIEQITPILEMKTLEEIQHYVLEISLIRAREVEQLSADKTGLLVQRMVKLIQEHLSNKDLSLQWLAKDFFYINVDYLGKLFRREMKEKFSQYVTRIRIESAMGMIRSDSECKLYEIAERTGFGDDSQYFSNVFKRHTGVSPSEYKRKCRNFS